MKITLQYITTLGSEWLEEVLEVDGSNYQEAIQDYQERNSDQATKLANKWKANGEEAELTIDVENISCDKQLFGKVFKIVASI